VCAVELRHGNDVAAEIGDVEHGIIQRGLPGTHAQRLNAAFQRGDAALQHVGGGIADPAVAVALGFEIEQRRAMRRAVEGIGDGLIDRHRHGLRRGVRLVAAVNGNRLALHDLAWHSGRAVMPCICARAHGVIVVGLISRQNAWDRAGHPGNVGTRRN
jgi:hypothetical protein